MVLFYLIIAVIFGVICSSIGKNRRVGKTAGFFWGFFLGLIGLIVVLNSKKLDETPMRPAGSSASDELMKYKSLLDSGAITQDEFNAKKAQLFSV